MPKDALEAIFVQREKQAQRVVEQVRGSALHAAKSHTLFVGPRGIGKTHLVSLIYHRLRAQDDLHDRLAVAWLREEEWGVASLLDLLLRILRALVEEDPALAPRLAPVTEAATPAAAEHAARSLLVEIIGDRTLLLLAENLDDLFDGLGDAGQKGLRSFLQETRFTAIVATAQGLFDGISRQTSPFYGFFRVQHLTGLSLDDAVLLLTKIAQWEEDTALAEFLRTPAGRARVRAIDHLAGGNPRVYVIFSEFLTRDALDELVTPFLQMLDELTPYYQAKMRSLSPQQRKIVELLSDLAGAVPVKEIAHRCFISHQTASGQLRELREKGYVVAHAIGRESFYEMAEPLMRLCLAVKKERGTPTRLFVDFLRLWCSRDELQRRLATLAPDAPLTEWHLREALRLTEGQDDPLVASCMKDYKNYILRNDPQGALQVVEELTVIRDSAEDWVVKGETLLRLERFEEAIEALDKGLKREPGIGAAWYSRGIALSALGDHKEALESLQKAHALLPDDAELLRNLGMAFGLAGYPEEALAIFDTILEQEPDDNIVSSGRAVALRKLGRYEEALAEVGRLLSREPSDPHAWYVQGQVLGNLGRRKEAAESYRKASELDPSSDFLSFVSGRELYRTEQYQQASASLRQAVTLNPQLVPAWDLLGNALSQLGKQEEALQAFRSATEADPENAVFWFNLGTTLATLNRQEDALASFHKAVTLAPQDADAQINYGATLASLGMYEEALEAFSRKIELSPEDALGWINKGRTLAALTRHEEALLAIQQGLNISPDDVPALYYRAIILANLGREQEALLSVDKALELDPDEATAWDLRARILGNLKQFEAALASFDQAISLGKETQFLLLNRAVVLLNLGRWDEALNALDNALSQYPTLAADLVKFVTETIYNFLAESNAHWAERITGLTTILVRYEAASVLGLGLLGNIPTLLLPTVSTAARRLWLETWRAAAGENEEMRLPLRHLDVAIRYQDSGDPPDPRILLELPIEERTILQSLLSVPQN